MFDTQINSSQINKPRSAEKSSSFSFMRRIADFVTTLTSAEVDEQTTKDGMVHFIKKNGNPEMIDPRLIGKTQIPNSVSLRADTIKRRTDAFESNGALEYMKDFVYREGRLDRKFLIEEISVHDASKKNMGQFGAPEVTMKNTSTGSILAHAKNAFREAPSVNQIEQLSVGDLMYIRFIDDSHVYSISVEDSSRVVNMKDGAGVSHPVTTALCHITYKDNGQEITQEGIICLPLKLDHKMTVIHKGKRITILHKPITNMKLRRKKDSTIH